MAKGDAIKAAMIFLFLFLMILPFAFKSFKVTNLSIVDVEERTNIKDGQFLIKSIDYVIDGKDLRINYVLKDESGQSRELKADYTLRYLDGDKIAEGSQTIVLERGQESAYKAVLSSPYEIKGYLRLVLTVSSSNSSQWAIKDVDNSKSYITAFAIKDSLNEKKPQILLALVLIVLAFIAYWIMLYLYRHNARSSHSFPKGRKILIPLDLSKRRKMK